MEAKQEETKFIKVNEKTHYTFPTIRDARKGLKKKWEKYVETLRELVTDTDKLQPNEDEEEVVKRKAKLIVQCSKHIDCFETYSKNLLQWHMPNSAAFKEIISTKADLDKAYTEFQKEIRYKPYEDEAVNRAIKKKKKKIEKKWSGEIKLVDCSEYFNKEKARLAGILKRTKQQKLAIKTIQLRAEENKNRTSKSNIKVENDKVKARERRSEKLKTEEEELKANKDKLLSEARKLGTRKTKLRTKKSELRKEKAKLRSKLSQLRTEESKLQDKEVKLEDEEAELEKQESKIEKEMSSLKKQETSIKARKNKVKPEESEQRTGENTQRIDKESLEAEESVEVIEEEDRKLKRGVKRRTK